MQRIKNPIFSFLIEEITVENHFQSLVRIALFVYAKAEKIKIVCSGLSMVCGRAEDLSNISLVQ
jgi:hypothetical protein